MTIRKTNATVLLSTLLLVSGTGFAAAQQNGAQSSFHSQLSETVSALRNHNSGSMGREERLMTEHHLQIAIDLSRQGRIDKAQQYLNFARGELDLAVGSNATTVAAMPFPSASKDLYTPNN
ncbi:MAG TPA: hypothetical protein VD978_35615 [Azospirillum sp.]|nr:hypothetical protein [Azospirillum sp.]